MDSDIRARDGADFPEINPNPVLSCRCDGALVFANPAASALASALACHTLTELLPQEHATLIARCMDSGDLVTAKNRLCQRIFTWSYRASSIGTRVNIYGYEITRFIADKAAESVTTVTEAALNRLGLPLLVVNDSLQILFMNQAADSIINASLSLLIRESRLCSPSAKVVQQLKMWAESGVEKGGLLRLPYQHDGSELEITPLLLENPGGTERAPLLLMCICVHGYTNLSIGAVVKQYYGLTAAEARLTNHLVQGATLKECAAALGIAMPTVRAQLRSIFRKTGTNRQSALLLKILSGSVGHFAFLKQG